MWMLWGRGGGAKCVCRDFLLSLHSKLWIMISFKVHRMRLFVLLSAALALCMPLRGQNSVADYSKAVRLLNGEGVQLGVALCGGSAFGYAHLGFLQALGEAGVRVDRVSGTSMGAIVGMFYAAGYSPREIVDIIKQERMVKKTNIFRLNFRNDGGLADYGRMRGMMAKYIPYNSFDSLKIPFHCCVADMNHLKPVYVSTGGNLREFVSASASVPRVFAPVMIDSVYYVDGYIFNNLPVEPLIEAGCNVTIGLYIQRDTVMERIDNPSIIASRAFAVNSNLCTMDHVPLCTYGVAMKVGDLSKLDFDKIDEFFECGYKAGKEFLEKLCDDEVVREVVD